jgi:transketolase
MANTSLEQQSVNTIRGLAMDGVQKANSGHPGMPMGAADMAYVIWQKFLRHNPTNPGWPNRDRFVLSAGHGSMLLYSLLHLTGYDLSMDELKNFRQWDSRTPGHPEYNPEIGIETTTGPLGQGFAMGVGMAIAEQWLATKFNRPRRNIIDHYTYAIVSDGDLMEGVSQEAASLAGHLKLGKLIYLYDDNKITIDGSTDLAFTEDRMARFAAYGWHTQKVDGHDRQALEAAIQAAQKDDRPSIITCLTHIGFGSPKHQDKASCHGAPLGEEEVERTKKSLGIPTETTFFVPDNVLAHFREAVNKGKTLEQNWQSEFDAYANAYPDLADALQLALSAKLAEDWERVLPTFSINDGAMATRSASGNVLQKIAESVPTLLGGSADLHPSNNTYLKEYTDIRTDDFSGRNIHYGVREHAMAAIINGMALHGGIIPYGGTFLIFADYMRPAIRLAAMMGQQVIYVFTHDSIGLGEDGPTHQPVEQLASLRAIPNLVVIRPADANETAEAWRYAVNRKDGPVALILTRQKLPIYDRSDLGKPEVERGAYILADSNGTPDVILMASGSEVEPVVTAREQLAEKGVQARVISVPSWELFEEQSQTFRDSVLPPEIKARVAVEAAVPMGWERYVGSEGQIIAMNRFGASAPYKTLMEKFGFTAENITAKTLAMLRK